MNKIIIPAILLGALTFLSCHKSSTPVASNCKITAIKASGNLTGTYLISYNGDGKISTVNYSDGGTSWTKNFTYGTNLIVVNTTGSSTATDSVYLNSNGDIDHIVNRQPPNSVTTTTLTYNSSHQLEQTVQQSGAAFPKTATYKFTNGDLTEIDEDGSTTVYAYYTDRPAVAGDLLQLSQWLEYGAIYEKSAHLIKAYGFSTPDEQVTYTFDGDGKVSSMTNGNGSSTTTFAYTYDCH